MIRLTTILLLLLAMSTPLLAQTSLIIPKSHTIDLANLEAPQFDTKKEKRKAKRTLNQLKKEEAAKAKAKWEQEYAALERQVTEQADAYERQLSQQLPDTTLIWRFLGQYRLEELDTMSYDDFEEKIKKQSGEQVDAVIASGEDRFREEIRAQDIAGRVEATVAPYRIEYEWLKAEYDRYKTMAPDSAWVDEQLQDSILQARLDHYLQTGESMLVARSGLGDVAGDLDTFYESIHDELYPIDLKPSDGFDVFEPLDYRAYLTKVRGHQLGGVVETPTVLADAAPGELATAMDVIRPEEHKSKLMAKLKELTNQHSTEMKQKTFAERSGVSGYIQLRRGDPTVLDTSPNFYYSATGRITLGVGFNYRFIIGEQDSLVSRTDQSRALAIRTYLEYELLWSLYLHLEYEHNDYSVGQDFEATDFPKTSDEHYLGIGRDFGLKGRWRTSFLLLYNLSQDDYSPNRNRWTVRWGFKI